VSRRTLISRRALLAGAVGAGAVLTYETLKGSSPPPTISRWNPNAGWRGTNLVHPDEKAPVLLTRNDIDSRQAAASVIPSNEVLMKVVTPWPYGRPNPTITGVSAFNPFYADNQQARFPFAFVEVSDSAVQIGGRGQMLERGVVTPIAGCAPNWLFPNGASRVMSILGPWTMKADLRAGFPGGHVDAQNWDATQTGIAITAHTNSLMNQVLTEDANPLVPTSAVPCDTQVDATGNLIDSPFLRFVGFDGVGFNGASMPVVRTARWLCGLDRGALEFTDAGYIDIINPINKYSNNPRECVALCPGDPDQWTIGSGSPAATAEVDHQTMTLMPLRSDFDRRLNDFAFNGPLYSLAQWARYWSSLSSMNSIRGWDRSDINTLWPCDYVYNWAPAHRDDDGNATLQALSAGLPGSPAPVPHTPGFGHVPSANDRLIFMNPLLLDSQPTRPFVVGNTSGSSPLSDGSIRSLAVER
jgi:hypothetical protein